MKGRVLERKERERDQEIERETEISRSIFLLLAHVLNGRSG